MGDNDMAHPDGPGHSGSAPSPDGLGHAVSVPCAEKFARQAHVGQLYGGKPYVDAHVSRVVQIVQDFGYGKAMQDAAWLHDAIEDTSATRAEISNLFGSWVAQLVWACTGEGHNRKTRNASIYEKIRLLPEAAIVKVADRIANVEASDPNSGHRQMYNKEAEAFAAKVALFVPGAMRDRLARAYTAKAIEARSAETERLDPQDESAVPSGIRPDPVATPDHLEAGDG